MMMVIASQLQIGGEIEKSDRISFLRRARAVIERAKKADASGVRVEKEKRDAVNRNAVGDEVKGKSYSSVDAE